MGFCSRRRKAGENEGGKSRGGMKTLLLGMLAGLALGLLFAPKPGTETMNDLKETLIRKLPV